MSTIPTLWKSETQVNTTDSGTSQNTPVVAALGDGGYVVVWTDQSLVHNPGGTAVVAQKYNALGQKLGGEVKISQFNSGNQSDLAVTAMPDGGFVVAFFSYFNGDYDLYARRYNVNLNLLRTDDIDLSNILDTNSPAITAFANGSYVISYTAGVVAGGADTDIVARIVSPSGSVGAPFDILNETDNRDDSQVATLSNGNFVVVFTDEFNGDSDDTDVLFRIMTAAGGQVTGPTFVAGAFSTELEFQPAVAALSGGGFVVVWTAPDAAAGDIHATIYTNTGSVVRSNFLVNTTQTGLQWIPDVLALDDGGFLVSWHDSTAQLVSAQRFNAGGDKVGSEFTVRAGHAGQYLDVAQLADGRIAYAYAHFSGDNDVLTAIWDPYGPRSGDFNHDVRGDILWQNTNGTVAQWFMNGGQAPATALLAAQPASWHIQSTGDFNQDTTADILWRHDDGTVAIWFMSGAQTIVTQTYGNAPPDWHIQGTADFNGDGKTDLLWRHDSGIVGTWHMNGSQVFSTQAFANAPPEWHIQGTGDFNGDGFDDILWRHDNGAVGTWHMAGAVQLSTQAFANQPLDWHIQGTGDFNGDGHDDILWRQDGGTVGIWLMNGAQIIAGPTFGGTGNDWQIEGTGDFNGDGNHDILWRNDNGTIAAWFMNGAQIVSTATFAAQPADWQIAGMQFDYI
jgi:hypothetical protein